VISLILKKRDGRLSLLAALFWVISVQVAQQIDIDNGQLAAAFLLSLGIWSYQSGRLNSKNGYWILSGVLLGLASLSRTVLLGVSICLGFGLLFERLKTISLSRKEQLAPVLLFFVSLGLVIAPWVVRNDMVFGVPVIGSTLTGYNVYRMNYIVANGDFSPHYVGPDEADRAFADLIQHGHLSGTENEAQMQAFYMKAGVQVILQHPFRYLQLSLYRFLPLWFNISVKVSYGDKLGLNDYIIVLQQAILLVAVIFGLVQNRKENWPFVAGLILGCAAYMAIDAQLRYLIDLMPLVVIIAASAFPIRASR
jgi:hypothetical protein